VFTPTQRAGAKALEHVKKASKLADSDGSRRLNMEQAAADFRRAAHLIDTVIVAETVHERDGWSLWQLDLDGVETPVLV